MSLPPRSTIMQETLEDIIQRQATEIQRLRTELEQTLRSRELSWKAQLNEFEARSAELQAVRKEKLYYEQLLSSQRSPTHTEEASHKLSQQLEQRDKENAALHEQMHLLNLK